MLKLLKHSLLWSLLLIFGSSSGYAASEGGQGPSCFVACLLPECQLKKTDPSGPPKSLPPAWKSGYQTFDACQNLSVDKGTVSLRYRHKGQWFIAPQRLSKDESFAPILKSFKPDDDCSIPSASCLQAVMVAKVASVGGHGIDSKVSKPGGEGNPCLLGFPCGRILPPAAAWRFQLEDAAAQGQWLVSLARGEPPAGLPKEFVAAVSAGVVTVDGSKVAPGMSCAYRFVDASGKERASGEFTVLARALADALKGMSAKRVNADTTEAMAWVDTLVSNEFDWDARQAVASGR